MCLPTFNISFKKFICILNCLIFSSAVICQDYMAINETICESLAKIEVGQYAIILYDRFCQVFTIVYTLLCNWLFFLALLPFLGTSLSTNVHAICTGSFTIIQLACTRKVCLFVRRIPMMSCRLTFHKERLFH